MATGESKETELGGTLKASGVPEPVASHAPAGRVSRAPGWIVALFVCGLLAWLVYSGIESRIHASAALTRVARASEAPTVSIVHPKAGAASQELVLPGNTQAYIDTPIYARTSGYLKRWYVDMGAHVRQGQLLAEIETPELDEQLSEAQAQLKSIQAHLQLSQITAARYQDLLKANSVSKQDTDQAVSDFASNQAMVAYSEADVRRLQQLKSFERVYAPFDGVITARNTDIGALIQAGDNSVSKELFHLAAIHRLRVYVAVPEVYAGNVHTGEKAGITLDSFPGQTFTGTLARNSDAIDPLSRTLNVEVDVDNPTGRLMPGSYAFVHLKIAATAGSVTIPSNTLLFRGEGLRVASVSNGRVSLVPITIGRDYGSAVEVVYGLTDDAAVILDPPDSLESGDAVKVENPQVGRAL
jgi:RND family efflux transporter MFP subunit